MDRGHFWWAFLQEYFDIGTLADLSNIGTLFAFLLVSLAVLILRPHPAGPPPEAFACLWLPWLPVFYPVLSCLILMAGLTLENWIRFFVWLAIGLVIYFLYSRERSGLNPAVAKEATLIPKKITRLVVLAAMFLVAPAADPRLGCANAQRLVVNRAVDTLPPELRGFLRSEP